MAVRIPQVESIPNALSLYYTKTELASADIRFLFGQISDSKIQKMKHSVKIAMKDNNIPNLDCYCINTKIAYKVWGIDIEELERRYNKLKKLGLQEAVG